jgi:hypothetical protein
LDANLQRDKYARLTTAVNQLIDELTPSAPDFQLRDACDQLVSSISYSFTCISPDADGILKKIVEHRVRGSRDAGSTGLCTRNACDPGSFGRTGIS